jgi:hypothetical protein
VISAESGRRRVPPFLVEIIDRLGREQRDDQVHQIEHRDLNDVHHSDVE